MSFVQRGARMLREGDLVMAIAKTVVVWRDEDAAVHAVGPTSGDARRLGGALERARERHQHAEIVPWLLHQAAPADVRAYLGGEVGKA